MEITQDEGANLANAVSARDGLLATTLGEIGVVLHAESCLPLGCVVPRPPGSRGPTESIAVGSD